MEANKINKSLSANGFPSQPPTAEPCLVGGALPALETTALKTKVLLSGPQQSSYYLPVSCPVMSLIIPKL